MISKPEGEHWCHELAHFLPVIELDVEGAVCHDERPGCKDELVKR